MTTLNDEELETARNDGLIRPDLPRAAIVSWKKCHRGENNGKQRRKKCRRGGGDRNANPSQSGDGHVAGNASSTDSDEAFQRLTAAWDEAKAFRDAWASAPSEARQRFYAEKMQNTPEVVVH